MPQENSVRDDVLIRSPTTKGEWDQVDGLLSALKAWDVSQSRALGFTAEDVLDLFYPADIGEIRRNSAPPAGCLLLAVDGCEPLGLAAYRQLTPTACELYDVYVRAVSRGRGIASRLVRALMSQAKSSGYRTMCLETATFMRDAHVLYRALAFKEREPYRRIPEEFVPATMWMECSLQG
jgi:GNAT superfamily N-acetyltransferase